MSYSEEQLQRLGESTGQALQYMLDNGGKGVYSLNGDDLQFYDNNGLPVGRQNTWGSNTRYNQLQNFPNNYIKQNGEYLPLNDREQAAMRKYVYPNNIADMAAVQRLSLQDEGLYSLLSRLFNGEGTDTTLQQAEAFPMRRY